MLLVKKGYLDYEDRVIVTPPELHFIIREDREYEDRLEKAREKARQSVAMKHGARGKRVDDYRAEMERESARRNREIASEVDE